MPDGAIIIRDAEASDFEAVKAVLMDAYAQYEWLLSKDRWEKYREEIIDSVSNSQVKARIIAELDGVVIGSVFLYDSSEAAYGLPQLNINTPIMRLLAVASNVRRRGVATQLIWAGIRRSHQWGADMLHLHTSEVMGAAAQLYERLGFERAHDKDIIKGDAVVKSYRFHVKEATQLWKGALIT
ncbi:GNAT family N-acetyltransferase [Paenibacillus sp. ACRRX]|uniref:GNAT family N-acetyltransferase n=1 Tax=Paenibacillus sp. ACRRX TaxID=2918206 RepID=UPI001EF55DDA|nr:GNAT family N-acetyltransferase [Paenibacillus sp. ACRRX]MCG7409261.1 GNAT family N-acetyltransferase [Paenibacillus sp. ACRRX]